MRNVHELFKNGKNFKLKPINPNSAKFKKQMKNLKKAQEECLSHKYVDIEMLRKTIITI